MKVTGTKQFTVGFVTADNVDGLQSDLCSRLAATASEVDLQFRMVALPDGRVQYGVMAVLAWLDGSEDDEERS